MFNVNLKALVERMNPNLKQALDNASGLCFAKTHYSIELEHWLMKILEQTDTDIGKILEQQGVNVGIVQRELNDALGRLRAGNTRTPVLAQSMQDVLKYAWLVASVDMGHNSMTSGHLLCAILSDDTLRRQIGESAPSIRDVTNEKARTTMATVFGRTEESRGVSRSPVSGGTGTEAAGSSPAGGSALGKFCINLTERAKNREIDPVLGRDGEIRQCIDILTRRRQNNPILTGEAGVGKTAVVEGFALRVAADDVPEPLKGVTIMTLDLGLLQAGASMKGEFENRLKAVIEEVKASPYPIIMFIDEAHTLVGAGGKEGQGDAANLLKPALARGELRTIAATTWAEYKKYFERDPALTRRFQVVKVEEPTEDVAIDMMRGISKTLQSHHKVRISDDAIVQSVKLSARYIPGRQLPDKSVSLLDTACARVALSQSATPSLLEDTRRRIRQLDTTISMIEQEHASSGDCEQQIAGLKADKAAEESLLVSQEAQWEKEREIISEIKDIRDSIETDYFSRADQAPVEEGTGPVENEELLTDEQKAGLQQKLKELTEQLCEVQGDQPLMQPHVSDQAVAEVVANWTGIPVGKMVGDEIHSILNLRDRLEERVIGQSHALEAIAQSIRTSRAGLTDPRKPIGVFMMVGSSGVGKTETALALADMLFGGEQNITVINMSEFKEEHKVSMLLGSPPGYVGYGEGGVLTEAARRKPYSVILLDEMEKAHQGVQDVFYSLFDKGTIKDGEGRDIDFKNTVIIMTSNAGEAAIRSIVASQEERPDPETLLDSMRPELLKYFKPAFLGRTRVITYYPLDDENLMKICQINMNRIEKRVREHYGAAFTYDEDVLLHIVARSQEVDTGARNIETILNRTLLPELASECLTRMADGQEVTRVHIGVSDDGVFDYQVS
ncbi:MAG: type VI secretion system ATPase TssH [Gammaproteobacteria bacterium]|nr:MAG: type VI secretion system ATPase TssH [Pseudomonadota bacterium]PIE37975.1 MAG: type VI secretion system ATPase TssH [Gammaproteobacteria bacterium]